MPSGEATAARIQGGQVVLRDLNMTDQQIRDINKIFIVACGSSYHVGMVGKYNLERMLRRSVEVCLASEFRYSDPIVGKGDLVIVISQSGETLDTMAALREAKRRGAHILSIVNVVGSSIARESHTVLYTWAGPEIAVATTKAYSTQMAVLNLLGLYFSQVMGTLDHAVYSAMVRASKSCRSRWSVFWSRRSTSTTSPSAAPAERMCSSSVGIWTTPCRWRGA